MSFDSILTLGQTALELGLISWDLFVLLQFWHCFSAIPC